MRYNAKHLRHQPTQEEVDKLPVKMVTQEELHKLMCEWDYNPAGYYFDEIGVKLPDGVVGQMDNALIKVLK